MIRDISYEQFEKDIKNYQHEYRENCKIQKAIDLLSGANYIIMKLSKVKRRIYSKGFWVIIYEEGVIC